MIKQRKKMVDSNGLCFPLYKMLFKINFQEARRLLIAQIQNIFYNDFLKILFGPEKWAKNGISTEVRVF